MDNIKTLTPLQIWQDFNPMTESLELNIISREIVGEIEKIEYGFTAIKTVDGRVRIRVQVTKKVGLENAPVLLYIPDYYEAANKDTSDYVAQGFAVATYDYSGKLGGKRSYACYPPSLDYGNIIRSGERLNTAKFGAKETSLHLWVKVTRRVLTLLSSLNCLSKDKVAAIAWGDGANILWQAAGMDARIDTVVSMLNCGYSEYKGLDKYGDNTQMQSDDEERTRWNAGCSIQAYAKFVTADVFCVIDSNDKKYSMDRLGDTMALLPEGATHTELINMGLQGQLYSSAHNAVVRYLTEKYINKTKLPNCPTLNFSVVEEKICVDIDCGNYDQITAVELYYSYKETKNWARNWHMMSIGVDMQNKAKTTLRVFEPNCLLFCMVNIIYRNGMRISSKLHAIKPSDIGAIKPAIASQRIIFEKKMGIQNFVPRTKKKYVIDEMVSFAEGPLEITGVTSAEGDLINYNIGDVKCEDEETLLQIDLFSAKKKEVVIVLTDGAGKEYSATAQLTEHEEWNKCQLALIDFKDSALIPLKEWTDIKFMTFRDAKDVLINNIIWV